MPEEAAGGVLEIFVSWTVHYCGSETVAPGIAVRAYDVHTSKRVSFFCSIWPID